MVRCLMAIWLCCTVMLMAGDQMGIYLVVDLTSSNGNYRYTDTAPDLSNDRCRTTELWLRRIPAGSFEMATDQERWTSGRSYRQKVAIDCDYYIGVFEITKKQWSLITGQNPDHKNTYVHTPAAGNLCADGAPFSMCNNNDHYPVECVSYNECVNYVGKLGRRTGLDFDLPTEAQWEYAHRINPDGSCASAEKYYPQGGKIGQGVVEMGLSPRNNTEGKDKVAVEYNTVVGTCYKSGVDHDPPFDSTPMGLYDMSGNVWEWCHDVYCKDGDNRVVRGGNPFIYSRIMRSPQRDYCDAQTSHSNIGLRVICTPCH